MPVDPAADSVAAAVDPQRFARQLVLPEIGGAGQQRLAAARVAVVGLGGLGCPAALYLAAAGIGRLTLIDDDRVALGNLPRQVLYHQADIGRPKVAAARERLLAGHAACRIDAQERRLTPDNAGDLLADHDLVLECSDRIEARYTVNDACLALRLPWVMGAVIRFEGQVTCFDPRRPDSPCFRCLYPVPPPPDAMPACAEAGVLGAAAGVIGAWQALEAVKLLTGAGTPLVGFVQSFDGLSGEVWRTVLRQQPSCSCAAAAVAQASSSLP